MSDEDEQSNEIMALQSIYEEDVFSCNISEKVYKGVVKIYAETGLEEHDFICGGQHIPLTYLSPVILNFSLPQNYPSECPPDVTLSCLWLTSQQLEDLSNILKDYWKESCSVVLFSWMDLIKTEMFKLLDVKFPIEISEMNFLKLTELDLLRKEEMFKNGSHLCPICFLEFHGSDCIRLPYCEHIFCKKCLAGFLSVCISDGNVKFLFCPAEECEDEIYPNEIKQVISVAEYEKYERLLLHKTLSIMQDIQYCPRPNCGKPVIVENDDLGFCHDCRFAFCIKCNSTYHGIESCKEEIVIDEPQPKLEVKSDRVIKLEKKAQEDAAKNSEKVYAEYFENKTRKELERKIEEARRYQYGYHNGYYNNNGFNGYDRPQVRYEDTDEQRLRMQKILEMRKDNKKLREDATLVQSYLKGSQDDQQALLSIHGKGKIDDAVNNHWISKHSQKCPKCSANIEKISGCNKMLCQVCRAPFCWVCLKVLHSVNPYQHFSDPTSTCYNLLSTTLQNF